jgi:6-phosphofructokinase 1
MTSNLSHAVAEFLHQKLKLRTRSSKPRILGRSSTAFLSETDRVEAYECGRAAVRAAVAGENGKMVTLLREAGASYRTTTGLVALEKVAGLTRLLPSDWIHPAGNDVTAEFVEYVKPLAGVVEPHARLRDVFVEKRAAR